MLTFSGLELIFFGCSAQVYPLSSRAFALVVTPLLRLESALVTRSEVTKLGLPNFEGEAFANHAKASSEPQGTF